MRLYEIMLTKGQVTPVDVTPPGRATAGRPDGELDGVVRSKRRGCQGTTSHKRREKPTKVITAGGTGKP